jgi:hypothetical protein
MLIESVFLLMGLESLVKELIPTHNAGPADCVPDDSNIESFVEHTCTLSLNQPCNVLFVRGETVFVYLHSGFYQVIGSSKHAGRHASHSSCDHVLLNL